MSPLFADSAYADFRGEYGIATVALTDTIEVVVEATICDAIALAVSAEQGLSTSEFETYTIRYGPYYLVEIDWLEEPTAGIEVEGRSRYLILDVASLDILVAGIVMSEASVSLRVLSAPRGRLHVHPAEATDEFAVGLVHCGVYLVRKIVRRLRAI